LTNKGQKLSWKEPNEETKEIDGKSVSSLNETFKDEEIAENDNESINTEEQKYDKNLNLAPIQTKFVKSHLETDSAEPETAKLNYKVQVNKEAEDTFKQKVSDIEKEKDASPDHQAEVVSKHNKKSFSIRSDSDDDDFIIKPSKNVF